VLWDSTAFFYRRCVTLDNEDFCETVIETATAMLFEANEGTVFDIIRSLFVA
jgi:hypothetical protein